MRIGLGKLVRILTTVEMMAKVNFDQLILRKKKKKGQTEGGKTSPFSGGHFACCLLKSGFIMFFSRTLVSSFPMSSLVLGFLPFDQKNCEYWWLLFQNIQYSPIFPPRISTATYFTN